MLTSRKIALLRNHLFRDVSCINGMPGANLRSLTQLEPGPFLGEVSRLDFNAYAITAGRYSHGVVGGLRTTRPMMTVYLPGSASINGREVRNDDVVFQWGRTEKIWRTEAGFSFYGFELPLEDFVAFPGMRDLMGRMEEGALLLRDPGLREVIRRYIELTLCRIDEPGFCMAGFLSALASECWGGLAQVQKGCRARRLTFSYRMNTFRRAFDLIMRDEAGGPANVAELALALGISERVLSSSFAISIGRSPREFLRVARLGKARAYIMKRAHEAESVVTAAAMRFGFWHLGRFSSYYREHFGEYPSETAAVAYRNRLAQGA